MKILINRYHPVCEDIAISLSQLGHNVYLSIKTDIKDHYGSWKDILNKLRGDKEFTAIDYKQAAVLLSKKKFDLVGVDGVFEGDSDLQRICRNVGVPHFAIAGYPALMDEPSDNILSLGWTLPTLQYIHRYPQEGARKLEDWKNISIEGRSSGKNVLVFYPVFHKFKESIKSPLVLSSENNEFVSGIQRYKECNPYNFAVFEQVRLALSPHLKVVNYQGLKREEFLDKLKRSKGLLHLKHADQPGISLFEALLLGKRVFTMKSFVLASNNQEVLIDGFNSVVADTVDELIERMAQQVHTFDVTSEVRNHAWMLTDFSRQKYKLSKFIEECVK